MTQATDAPKRRMKWNDIRIIGPLLMAMFAAVTFVSPNFVGAANGVGVEGFDDCPTAFASADLADTSEKEPDLVRWTPCIPDPCEYYNSAAVIITGPDGECCLDDTPVVGGIVFQPCSDEKKGESEADGASVNLPPPPDPIRGPIWLGAIQVDASVPGLVTLDFPDLLATMIEDNIVRVYDADGVKVFEGRLGAGGSILVFSDNAPMEVKTTLTTRAAYYETVGASTAS